MQNPVEKLTQGKWYQVASGAVLHKTKSVYSTCITKIPQNALVMFLQYHPGSVRICKVSYQDFIGWIMIREKYKDHMHFFKKA